MNRPNQFIINSQFPTQKNEDGYSGNIIIPGSTSIPAGATATGRIDLIAGSIGSISRGRISSTKSTNPYVTQAISYTRTGTVSGSPAPYTMVAFIWRSAPDTLTFQVLLKNGYGSTLISEAGTETIQFYSSQFVAPYA